MTILQILVAWFLASILAGLALGRVMRGPTASSHLQPPQHAVGSDGEGLETQISNINHGIVE